MSEAIEPFRIQVSDATLADLRERLSRTRFPDQIEGAAWDYGTELGYLRELVAYWRDKFDWRAQEAALNRFPQFRTAQGGGQRVHFLHVRSPHPNAFPLVITHGWPGSIFEFHKIIGPLVDPPAHGGDARDAFHVVCPSIPGYGFSDPPRTRGWDTRRMAETNAQLMAQLGYARYGAQGGDWGAIISTQNALVDPQHCTAIHLNMVVAFPPQGVADPTAGLSDLEKKAVADLFAFQKDETGYQAIQGSKPQTLGYGLNDSPAGLAAWIVEKFRTWSDCGGDVEKRFTKDELLTNVMIYWASGSIASSTRLYYETMKSGRFGPATTRVEQPTGCAIFPKELYRAPRAWAERAFNVQQWTVMAAGGHFAALEEPRLLVDDVRSFFAKVR
jgi:pimeloyl-ACP methyl ester carboxylesterase